MVLLIYLLPLKILLWFLIWLSGTAVALMPPLRIKIPLALGYAAFFSALVWSRFDTIAAPGYTMYSSFVRDCVVAMGCFLLFASLNQRLASVPERDDFHLSLAEFSYTTYLVHVPFLLFTVAFLNVIFGVPFHMQPSFFGFLYLFSLLVAVYLYSYCFSRLTERHTEKFRKYLTQRFTGRGVPAVPKEAQAGLLD